MTNLPPIQFHGSSALNDVFRRKLLEAGFIQEGREYIAPEGWTPERTEFLYRDAAREMASGPKFVWIDEASDIPMTAIEVLERQRAYRDRHHGYPPAVDVLQEDGTIKHIELDTDTHEVYFVSGPDYQTVAALALWIVQGKVPDLYKTPDSAISAWEGHPEPCKSRYRPWAVTVSVSRSTGFPAISGRRDLTAKEEPRV